MIEVQRIMDGIKKFLGTALFSTSFAVILTDNGSEFHDPLSLETDPNTGEKLIQIFYCLPRHSEQKGKCEKNHEHFREMVPKGVDMAPLSRKEFGFISNNVNNYPRPTLGYKSPYQLASAILHKKVLDLNKLSYLPLDSICLKPIIH